MARVVHGRRSRQLALALSVSSTSVLAVLFSHSARPPGGVSDAGVLPTATGLPSVSSSPPPLSAPPAAPVSSAQSPAADGVSSTLFAEPSDTSGPTSSVVSSVSAPSGPVASSTSVLNFGASGLHDGVFRGSQESNRWGVVEVEVEVASGEIVAVRTLQSPSSRRKSVSINQRALPLLESQVLSVQSAAIQAVSGATYTSVSYAWSVQSALDAARAG